MTLINVSHNAEEIVDAKPLAISSGTSRADGLKKPILRLSLLLTLYFILSNYFGLIFVLVNLDYCGWHVVEYCRFSVVVDNIIKFTDGGKKHG